MILFIVLVSAVIWVIMQGTREKNLEKWKRRFDPVRPVARTLVNDAKATQKFVHEYPDRRRRRREIRGTHIPDDLSGI